MLIDRFKGKLYKYFENQANRITLRDYPMDNFSLSGYVGNSCTPMQVDNIEDEQKFNADIDDPKGISDSVEPARQIIC